MELRVLQYFLAVAREESITKAAQSLHLSQPTLSRQLRDLEEELGKQLLIREPRRVLLTDEGAILRRRAEEILSMVDKAEKEIRTDSEQISGDVYIGAGETQQGHLLTLTASRVMEQHPSVHIHIISGDTTDVRDKLDKGLYDFGLLFEPIDRTKYNILDIPRQDRWGVIMRKDSHLARMEAITPADLEGLPLIFSRQMKENDTLANWFQRPLAELPIAATYNLAFYCSLMVEDGIGYALGVDGILNLSGNSVLTFRPLDPPQTAQMSILWKKHQVLSKAAECYLNVLQKTMI